MDSAQGLRSASASAIATQTKILLANNHVGLLVIDEIQNAVLTARKNHQEKPLLRFLVELTNETMTSIYFVGTPIAEELFVSQEHLKRRTRGIRLAPFRPDGAYLDFLNKIWPYQYTVQMAELTTSIGNKLYDCSGGIPAYIIKIFGESQAQALMQGRSCIDEKIIQRAVEMLAIKVPRTYASGTHISDFEIGGQVPAPPEQEEVPRQYAVKRGRTVPPVISWIQKNTESHFGTGYIKFPCSPFARCTKCRLLLCLPSLHGYRRCFSRSYLYATKKLNTEKKPHGWSR